ncbi:hypothetical protein ADL01_18755 [Streptomyces sp. NRRL WC-3618]|uniref:hypothetical protein n=1 Tax=Streptomyces sp. NRRL WC-3618 TaxID=1519490 RepID=UPI0006AF6973|nr:hypothetical protein [Streptomyces sp. NRRL WC-3618]KOV73116.1 hypothetical protein ADL01_18755 [Streptomyces sp. NRRL WC-3618]
MRKNLVGRVLLTAGLALVPWLAVLWATLPASYSAQRWRVAWVGFDALEIAGLLTSALLVRRGDRRAPLATVATAVLLLVDAWFDVMTAGGDVVMSLVVACTLELPLAALCAVAALRPPVVASARTAPVRRAAVHV